MKPMLAATIKDLHALSYPLVASPKLDGIRAIVYRGSLLSRSMKPIPNMAAQDKFAKLPHGWDGELIVGAPTAKDCFQRTTSQVMSRDGGVKDMQYYVFDNFSVGEGFAGRNKCISPEYALQHEVMLNAQEVEQYETRHLALGYEGVMLRSPYAPYKYGRSTLREQGLMKLKRFLDDEALVTGFEEMMHNNNAAFTGELGQTKRSTHQANQMPAGTLGAIVVRWRGQALGIGTGFTAMQRDMIWVNRRSLIGALAKFKYLPIGMKDLPRHPVFLGFRDRKDI